MRIRIQSEIVGLRYQFQASLYAKYILSMAQLWKIEWNKIKDREQFFLCSEDTSNSEHDVFSIRK